MTIIAWRPPVDNLQVESVVEILKVFEFAANYSKHNSPNGYKIELINEYLFFLESKCGGAENRAFYTIIGYDLSAPVVWATDSFPIDDD